MTRLCVVSVAAVLLATTVRCRALERLFIRSGGPVTVTLDHVVEGEHRYRNAGGQWLPLPVTNQDGRCRFSLPADAGPETPVLLDVPPDLDLDDDVPPVLTALQVGGREVASSPSVLLGHLAAPFPRIVLEAADGGAGIDPEAVVALLDGRRLSDDAVTSLSADGGHDLWKGSIGLPAEMPDGTHRLVCRIPDRAGVRNVLTVALEFVTGPLMRNGDFESGAEGEAPPWRTMMWSRDASTRATLSIVDGEGRGHGRCARIEGIAGSLNLLFGQTLSLPEGARYRLSGWYRATHANAYVSLIGTGKTQYDNSSRLAAADTWQPFEWTFTVKPDGPHTLYLRSSLGTVWFDDVSLVQVEGP